MTRKADEPRTVMRVPVSFRDHIREKAQKHGKNMLEYLVETIEAGERRQATTPTTTHKGEAT